jgi:hypothetical protein
MFVRESGPRSARSQQRFGRIIPARQSLNRRNRKQQLGVVQFRYAPLAQCTLDNKRGLEMKATTIFAIALGLGSLAACNKSSQQQAADNYEANADNAAEQMETNVDNAADQMTANADTASDAMKSAADNKSDAMKNAADNKADQIANNSQ